MQNEKIFKVSEFNELIDILVSQQSFVIEGEITEISVSQKRWVFITIKDNNSNLEIFSTIDQISNIDALYEGMLVHVYGTPRLHRKSGRFRLHAYQILPAGEGEKRIAFEKLKIKLENEGLFSSERKRQIVKYPEKIGLLTAAHSAALSDFLKILKNRMTGLKIYHLPISVGGGSAVKDIVNGIKYLNHKYKNLDMIILTRGGGSLEDLQAFNNEKVARSIFSSKIPIVSAVGHEKDWTISDLVADLRASTPSNAAELIVISKEEILNKLNNLLFKQTLALKDLLRQKKENVSAYLNRIEKSLFSESVKFKNTVKKLDSSFQNYIYTLEKNINFITGLSKKTSQFLIKILEKNKFCLNKLEDVLKILDYQNILNRGFSITFNQDGKIIKNSLFAKPGSLINTKLSEGNIISKIQKKG